MTYRNTCSNCGTGLSGGSKSGKCVRCSKLIKFSGRHCILCPKPIGKGNKSGICRECRIKIRREGKSEYVKKMEDVSSVLVKKKTGKWTTCHMPGCDEYFELREGQHPKMAWCSRCQQTPGYKNYGVYTNMTRTLKW